MTANEVLQAVREVTGRVIAAQADEVDRLGAWPQAGMAALGEAGLMGLVVPKEAGGLGHGLLTLARVCEIIGRECASTALCFGMHCVGVAVIAARATPGQAQRYLAPICRGEHVTTLALSEPGTGVHFYFPSVSLQRNEDGRLRVTGRKSFVTNGGHADSYVVSVRAAGEGLPAGHFSCVVVPGDTAGLSWGPAWDGMGMRGNASRVVDLDVNLSADDLLGEEGDQLWYVFHVVAPHFLMAMAGTYLGIAAAAFDLGREGIEREHEHSGASLTGAPVLQHRVGRLWAMVERTRRLIYHAADEADLGGDDALPGLCAAKAEVAECAVEVVNESMTLAGGRAYRNHGRFQRLLRDARAAHVMAPTTDLLRLWTGRHLLGRPLLEE